MPRYSSDTKDEELRQFRRFAKQLYVSSLLYGTLEFISAFVFSKAVLAVAGFTAYLAVVMPVIAGRLAKREQLGPASLLVGYAMLLVAIINGPFFTIIAPTLAVLPFAAVAVVLPHVQGRALTVFFIATIAADMSVAGFGALFPGRPALSPFFVGLFSISSMAVLANLTLLLLFQFRSRVRHSLERAEEAIRARDEFIAIASHELLTPLTPLSLNAAALRRAKNHVPSPPLGSVSGKIQNIDRQVRRFSRLVNELLDISRIASRRMSLELSRVDLGAMSRDVVSGYEAELARAGCTVSLHIDADGVQGEWDRHRLEQVLWNLLSNAVKFGAGKPVEISVSASKGIARMKVRDHGIGIPPQDQRRIFEQFERAVSTQHYGGFELGLWISRMIVEAMGGSIWVESKPGQGSTFGIQLPQVPGGKYGRGNGLTIGAGAVWQASRAAWT